MKVSVNGIKLNRWYVYCYIDMSATALFLGIFDTWLSLKDFWDILTKVYTQQDVFVREEQLEESVTMDLAAASEPCRLAVNQME